MYLRLLLLIVFLSFFSSCSRNEPIYVPAEIKDPYVLYEEGYNLFSRNNFFQANKKFAEAELNFDDTNLAAKSAIMSCFSLYGINFYNEALNNIERFLKAYPADSNVMYAEYLKAIIFFEQMGDEKKDINPLLKANKQINYFLKKYPNSEYAIDLGFKKNLIENQLAAKELFVAKYYVSVQKWIPAINRLKNIVNNYNDTPYIEEALHRLVEIHYYIGLENQAQKYATILGYNYNSSEWFEQSYKILNKEYSIKKINKKDEKKEKENLIKKIIKMIK
jgi:outer membrane protein assembly factor BamD